MEPLQSLEHFLNTSLGKGLFEGYKILLDWVCFQLEDKQNIGKIQSKVSEAQFDKIVDSLYDHFQKFPETSKFLTPELIPKLKKTQKRYFLELLEGNYDKKYVLDRFKVGLRHAQVQLPLAWYLGAYAKYIEEVQKNVFAPWVESSRENVQESLECLISLLKIIFFDIILAIEAYQFEVQQILEEKEEIIEELATPVIRVWEKVLVLPLVGSLDSQRAMKATETLLERIVQEGARITIIDITGIPFVDSAVADHLIKTVNAAKLLGCEVILCGIGPKIAQTLVHLGVEMGQICTKANLSDALEHALDLLGFSIAEKER